MTKPHNVFSYVRQRTFRSANSCVRQRTLACATSYVRYRTIAFIGVTSLIALTGCASSTAAAATPRGLDSIQSAMTCPPPPTHAAVAAPVPGANTRKTPNGHRSQHRLLRLHRPSSAVISVRLRPEFAPDGGERLRRPRPAGGFTTRFVFMPYARSASGSAVPGGGSRRPGRRPPAPAAGGPGTGRSLTRWSRATTFSAQWRCTRPTQPASVVSSLSARATSSTLARKYDIFGRGHHGLPALPSSRRAT